MGVKIIAGTATGPVLATGEGLSFWGGIDPATGRIIDVYHPLHGQSITGKILVLPTTRGSCTGSGVLLEAMQSGHGPAALVFREDEEVATLGALVAREVFGLTLPVLRLAPAEFDRVAGERVVSISDDAISGSAFSIPLSNLPAAHLDLSAEDRAMLDGSAGPTVRAAIGIITTVAAIQGARRLIDVTQVHIDGCIYAAPAFLRFARHFADRGARVRVPTTMNAISVDHANWRRQGVPAGFGGPASALADAYVEMGARASFTCAPYLLESVPSCGEIIAWGESNAVIYANSVIGARTPKYPDFLDLCVALTGRAPHSGVYLDDNRRARRIISVEVPPGHDEAFWPMLGYLTGVRSPDRIPLLVGLEQLQPSADDLKALCAAFGTTSSAPMLHIAGITPEADAIAPEADHARIARADFCDTWRKFNAAPAEIDLVAFGSPHVSAAECRALARLVEGKHCAAHVTGIVTIGRDTAAAARAEGLITKLEAAGLQIIPDLCWCSISEPVFPPAARTLMTNSGKYAHYAPGLSGRGVRFGSLAQCVEALTTGHAPEKPPAWCG